MRFLFLLFGLFLNLLASFAFLGGPEGKILSSDSFTYGFLFLIPAVGFLYLSTKCLNHKWIMYMPICIDALCFISAVSISHRLGLGLWIILIPCISIWCIIYMIIALTSNKT